MMLDGMMMSPESAVAVCATPSDNANATTNAATALAGLFHPGFTMNDNPTPSKTMKYHLWFWTGNHKQ